MTAAAAAASAADETRRSAGCIRRPDRLVDARPVPYGSADHQRGYSIDLVGNIVIVGAWADNGGAGSVYAFDARNGTQFGTFEASDAAPLDTLGRSVALSGSTILAGAPGDDDLGYRLRLRVSRSARRCLSGCAPGRRLRSAGLFSAPDLRTPVGGGG